MAKGYTDYDDRGAPFFYICNCEFFRKDSCDCPDEVPDEMAERVLKARHESAEAERAILNYVWSNRA